MATRLFDPNETSELLRGWQLHTVRRRIIHEAAARRLQRSAYVMGVVGGVLSAVAGSAAFVAWTGDDTSTAVGIVGLAVGLAAAVISQIQTFLDLGARAEQHRQAAVRYKQLLRSFERISPDVGKLPRVGESDAMSQRLDDLEKRLAEADAAAPVVPAGLAAEIEGQPVEVVDTAKDMTGG